MPPSSSLLPLLLAAGSAAALVRAAHAGTTTVDLYRNNPALDNLGGESRPAKNVAVSVVKRESLAGGGRAGLLVSTCMRYRRVVLKLSATRPCVRKSE
jgi:hypothetical protein